MKTIRKVFEKIKKKKSCKNISYYDAISVLLYEVSLLRPIKEQKNPKPKPS